MSFCFARMAFEASHHVLSGNPIAGIHDVADLGIHTTPGGAEMEPPPGMGSAVFGNARVLIVEDSEVQRTTLAGLVRLWGYDTETASDGLEALEKMRWFRPRVVISDLQMPRMGGMELLGALRSRVPDVHCIIVTGYGTFEKAEAATALGAIDYLEKPLDLERLREDLRRPAPSEGAGQSGSLLHNSAQAA